MSDLNIDNAKGEIVESGALKFRVHAVTKLSLGAFKYNEESKVMDMVSHPFDIAHLDANAAIAQAKSLGYSLDEHGVWVDPLLLQ